MDLSVNRLVSAVEVPSPVVRVGLASLLFVLPIQLAPPASVRDPVRFLRLQLSVSLFG